MTPWSRPRFSLAAGLAATVLMAGAATAGPALLFDAQNGHVLYAEDADDYWHPASVTKVMTAYLTFQHIKDGTLALDTKVVQSELSHSMPPSKIGLPIGGELTVEVALQALIVKSANDVAVMLAEKMGGSAEEFVKQMNFTAKRLGMSRTTFVNPNGLPAPEQVTTARDLAKLARAVMREYPQYASLWSMADMRIGRIKLRTHNRLLKTYEGADGLKTGFTCDSGYNVIATASRDGRKLVAIVLGEPSGAQRNLRTANLLEHGFQYAPWQGLLGGKTIDALPVATDTKSAVTSVRETVAGFECGRRRRPVVAKSQQKRQQKAAQVRAAQKAAGGTGAAALVAPAAAAAAPAAPTAPAAKAN